VELVEALAVGLLDFSHVLNDLQRGVKELAIDAVEEYGLDLRLHLLFGTGNGGPCVAVTLPPLGVSVHLARKSASSARFLSRMAGQPAPGRGPGKPSDRFA